MIAWHVVGFRGKSEGARVPGTVFNIYLMIVYGNKDNYFETI